MAVKGTEDHSDRKMQVLPLWHHLYVVTTGFALAYNIPIRGNCADLTTNGAALAAALQTLGYRPYDYLDRFFAGHLKLWSHALRAKFYGQGREWQKADFDQVLTGFDALLDQPCYLFTDELLAAYPHALVILNTRPFESWYSSMVATVWYTLDFPTWRLLQYTAPQIIWHWYQENHLVWGALSGDTNGKDYSNVDRCRKAFTEHYEHVREVVPQERLLEYPIGAGWEPLCKFLGKEVPEGVAFPHVNDQGKLRTDVTRLWWYAVTLSFINALKFLVPVVVCGGAVAWMYSK
ncbi:MAG: hypothetical protein Q9168_001123 [Polycauliona sp. 1 TL-2023]